MLSYFILFFCLVVIAMTVSVNASPMFNSVSVSAAKQGVSGNQDSIVNKVARKRDSVKSRGAKERRYAAGENDPYVDSEDDE